MSPFSKKFKLGPLHLAWATSNNSKLTIFGWRQVKGRLWARFENPFKRKSKRKK